MAQSARFAPRFFRCLAPDKICGGCLTLVFILSLCVPNPALALRPEPPTEADRQVPTGLEESLTGLEEARFVPWEGAPDRVLVRPAAASPLQGDIYSMATVQRLEEVFKEFAVPYLRDTYGIDETPLIPLPSISAGLSQRLGKEVQVYLFRDDLWETGSAKPRMTAPLLDLYAYGDPKNVTGQRGKPLRKVWGTQSTGNHLLAMACAADTLRKRFGWTKEKLLVRGFTSNDIPETKKGLAKERYGAEIWDGYPTYQQARLAVEELARRGELLHWTHGDKPIVASNMTAAAQLLRQLQGLGHKGKQITLISPTGAGGRLAGLGAGIAQTTASWPGDVRVIGAETLETPPVFQGVKHGKPVPISLSKKRVLEDGIAVDQVEPEALRVILQTADAIALLSRDEARPYARWLLEELRSLERKGTLIGPAKMEFVAGVALGAAFHHWKLLKDSDVVVIDGTGLNIDPEDFQEIDNKKIPLPDVATVGLEEPPWEAKIREIRRKLESAQRKLRRWDPTKSEFHSFRVEEERLTQEVARWKKALALSRQEQGRFQKILGKFPELEMAQWKAGGAPVVLITIPVGKPVLEALGNLDVTVLMPTQEAEPIMKDRSRYQALVQAVDPDFLFTFFDHSVDAQLLDEAVTPNLKWVIHAGLGHNNIDRDAARHRNIGVAFLGTPGEHPLPPTVSESDETPLLMPQMALAAVNHNLAPILRKEEPRNPLLLPKATVGLEEREVLAELIRGADLNEQGESFMRKLKQRALEPIVVLVDPALMEKGFEDVLYKLPEEIREMPDSFPTLMLVRPLDLNAVTSTFKDSTYQVFQLVATPRDPELYVDKERPVIQVGRSGRISPEILPAVVAGILAQWEKEERPFSMDFDATPYQGIRGLTAKDVWDVLREHFTSV